jgi:hypothetical protein
MIRVMRDGSGDFTTLQPAGDSAARGDTLLIGPGEYPEYALFTAPDGSWSTNACLAVRVDSLTVMGTDRDAVRISPPPGLEYPERPEALITSPGLTFIEIRDLTVENTWDGMLILCGAIVTSCVFRDNDKGIAYQSTGGLEVLNCIAERNQLGFYLVEPAANATIFDCEIRQCVWGVAVSGASHATVSGCNITGCEEGVSAWWSTDVTVNNCLISDGRGGITVGDNSGVTIVGSHVGGTFIGLLGNHGTVNATGSVFTTSGDFTMRLHGTLGGIHGSHIMKGTQGSVRLRAYYDQPPRHIDMRDNYWGTASADSIAAWIQDGRDDPTVFAYVDFLPFSPVPVPEKKESFGSVKSLFRGRR